MTSKMLFVSLAFAVLTAACAESGDHPGPPGPGGGPGGGPRAGRSPPNVFISPAGKPFRGGPNQPYPVAVWFASANTAHDGKLTREEFKADAAAFFQELDTNHDGFIDGFELQHYEKDVAPEINPEIEGLHFGEGMDLALGREQEGQQTVIGQGPHDRDRSREQAGDRRAQGAGLFGLLNEPEPVAACDQLFNSHITLQEFLDAADRRFTALDKKGLGYLSLATLPKTPVQILIERERARRAKQHPAGPGNATPAGPPPAGTPSPP